MNEHALVVRCQRVVDSCKTREQFDTSCQYVSLARKACKDREAQAELLSLEVNASVMWQSRELAAILSRREEWIDCYWGGPDESR